jgi:hypothetical protein
MIIHFQYYISVPAPYLFISSAEGTGVAPDFRCRELFVASEELFLSILRGQLHPKIPISMTFWLERSWGHRGHDSLDGGGGGLIVGASPTDIELLMPLPPFSARVSL